MNSEQEPPESFIKNDQERLRLLRTEVALLAYSRYAVETWANEEGYVRWLVDRLNAGDDRAALMSTYAQEARDTLCDFWEDYFSTDLSRVPPLLLRSFPVLGEASRKHIEMYRVSPGEGRFNPRKERLPLGYIELLCKCYSNPFKYFHEIMGYIVVGRLAEEEIARRGLHLGDIKEDNDAIREMEDFVLKDFVDENERISQPHKLDGTWDWLRYMGKQGVEFTLVNAIEGKLERIRRKIIKNNFIDELRREKRISEKEITVSQIDARRKAQGKEVDTPFFDTIPSPEQTPEELMLSKEPIDLKSLGLNTDELAPKELSIIEDVLQGLAEGYSFSAKQGNSFRAWWGKDYERNIKAFNRARVKLTKH